MPAPIFLLFELGVYCLAGICLRHAWPRGPLYRLALVIGVLYGVLLEYLAIETLHAYDYGQFLVTISGTVPLCIGVSWGIILYTAMATSDCFSMPWYLRPVVDALLALTIDLSMDAIAIRLGFWTWRSPGAWFGVPLSNFYAWFIVVAGFSLLIRLGLLWSYAGGLRFLSDLVVAAIAIPLALFGLTSIIQPIFAPIAQGAIAWLITSLLLGGSLLLAIWAARQTTRQQPVDLVLLCVPASFHVFFFGALFWAGMNQRTPALVAISVLMFLLGLALHAWPMSTQASG